MILSIVQDWKRADNRWHVAYRSIRGFTPGGRYQIWFGSIDGKYTSSGKGI